MMRQAGILCPVFALPGLELIGTLGEPARRWTDSLSRSGQRVWQVLPVHPPGYGSSPYSASSSFGGDLGILDIQDFSRLFGVDPLISGKGSDRVDYTWVNSEKKAWLYDQAAELKAHYDYSDFCEAEASWLEPFSWFHALKRYFQGQPWWRWKVFYNEGLIKGLPEDFDEDWVDQERFLQWVWFLQWEELRAYARKSELEIFGDLPLFLAHDSDSVWAEPGLFKMDDQHQLLTVAGVPPDYFSRDGQRWGNPVYDWGVHLEQQFSWWKKRLQHASYLFDQVRIDHFRGLQATWEIPAASTTARNGSWVEVPGNEFLSICSEEGLLDKVVAEDLGVITPEVEALRDDFGLPGMVVLQFAFDGGQDNPHPPHRHRRNQVVYTGTHDNTTLLGWWTKLTKEQKSKVRSYFGTKSGSAVTLVRAAAYTSVAKLCIVPIQDWLGLPGACRWNTPGKSKGNWSWRCDEGLWDSCFWDEMNEMTKVAGRS